MEYSFEIYVDHSNQTKNYILKGTIEFDTLIDYLRKAFAEINNNCQYNILVDIREAELPDFLKRMNDYIDFLLEVSKRINLKRRCAIITAKPADVVIAELMRIKLADLKSDLSIGVFSTREAALYWII